MSTNNAWNNASPNIAAHAIVISEGASPQVGVVLGAGQVLVGVASADPVAQTLANVNTWVSQSTSTVTMAINTGYVITDASAVTLTTPATAALGSVFEVVGTGAGGWTCALASGQNFAIGNETGTATTGTLASTNAGDCIRLVCTVANTTFRVVSMMGNVTYT